VLFVLFSRQIIHIVVQSLLCLALMRILEPGLMEKAVLALAMAYLCVCHLYRMYYDYGGYTLDITGSVLAATEI
jgi:lysophospholipid acyltransferase 1/2